MKNIRGEVAACVLGLGMVVSAAWLAFLFFRFSVGDIVWWVAGPMNATFTHPSEAWIAAGLLYVLAVSCFAFVVATVGGIASLDLYRYAKIREKVRIVETELPA
jgi:hypothetical protein